MEFDDIVFDIDEHYRKTTLWSLASYMGLKGFESLNKSELIILVITNLRKTGCFNKLYSSISREAQIVLKYLVWFGPGTLRYIESKNHIKISLDDYYGNSDDEFIKLFKVYNLKTIQLSPGLRTIFKIHIDMPKAGIVREYTDNDITGAIVESSSVVLDNLEAIKDFIDYEQIKDRGLNKKVLLKSKNKFIKMFEFREPFKDLDGLDNDSYTIGSELLLHLLCYLKQSGNPIDDLSGLISMYREGRIADENIDYYLFYPFIRGINNNYNLHLFLKRSRFVVLNSIKSSCSNRWTNIESLINSLSFSESTQVFDTTYFGKLLSIKVDKEFSRDYSTEINLQFKEDNNKFLVSPMVKGIITLLFTLGAVDIVIDRSEVKYRQKVDKKALTPFDSLSHFRLTSLGLKLFGLESNYKTSVKKKSNYTIHKNRTMITIERRNSSLGNYLKRVGDFVGGNTYLISYRSFFRECKTEEDLEYNLKRLNDVIKKDIPEVWIDFIEGLNDRINPMYNEQELLIVNFPMENSAFINTILENSKIRSLFLMVEGFKGAFSRRNYKQFKKLMSNEGFFI